MNGTWVRSREATKYYGVCGNTLRSWAKSGLIEFQLSKGGHRIYRIGTTDCKEFKPMQTKKSYVYARVSSAKQGDDLQRQTEFLRSKFPTHEVITDIGSGLNYKRRGLNRMLDEVCNGRVEEIVVASKDRLCRFGTELIQWLCDKNNTKLIFLEQSDKSPEQEFTEDVLAILQVFACRWNGKRKYTINQGKKNKIVIDVSPENGDKEVEG